MTDLEIGADSEIYLYTFHIHLYTFFITEVGTNILFKKKPLNQFSAMDLFERAKVSVIYLFVVRGTNLFSQQGYLCVYRSCPIYAFGESAFSFVVKRVQCCSVSASGCMYCNKTGL